MCDRVNWIGLSLLALLAACDATPTPTTAPPQPVEVTAPATGREIFRQLSTAEQNCIRESLNANALGRFLDMSLSDNGQVYVPDNAFLTCLSTESALALFIGTINIATGGLSPSTLTCIRNTLDALRGSQVLNQGQQSQERMVSSLPGMLLCLTDDEAAKVSLASVLGGPSVNGPTLADIRCMIQHADVGELLAAFNSSSSFEPTDSLLDVLLRCGLTVSGQVPPLGPGDAEPAARGNGTFP